MTVQSSSYSRRDRLAGKLVLLLIICMVLAGALLLYSSGLFAPVQSPEALADATPLDLSTQPPILGFFRSLIPSASAEEAPAEENAQEDTSELDALLAEIITEEQETEIPDSQRVTVSPDDLSINENLPDDWFNVLLLATDSRDVTAKKGRTDVMIIASIHPSTGEVKLSSLARDLYVSIPGGIGQDRINTAYAYGGPLLALKTVNSLLELNIRYYAVVNFQAMANIVDTLGGVDIELEGIEYQYINYNVAVSEDYEGFAKSDARRTLTSEDVGLVHLDGLQAVAYARIRMLDNDLHRGSRQRVLLETMLSKVLENADLTTLTKLTISVMSDVETNLPLTTIISLAGEFLQSGGLSMSEFSLPMEGTSRYSVEKDMDVVIMQLPANVEGLHRFIYGEYIPASGEENQ